MGANASRKEPLTNLDDSSSSNTSLQNCSSTKDVDAVQNDLSAVDIGVRTNDVGNALIQEESVELASPEEEWIIVSKNDVLMETGFKETIVTVHLPGQETSTDSIGIQKQITNNGSVMDFDNEPEKITRKISSGFDRKLSTKSSTCSFRDVSMNNSVIEVVEAGVCNETKSVRNCISFYEAQSSLVKIK